MILNGAILRTINCKQKAATNTETSCNVSKYKTIVLIDAIWQEENNDAVW